MSDSHRFLLLAASGDEQASAEKLDESLRSWCEAGMLGDVAFMSVGDLRASGFEAECRYNSDGEWAEGSLRQAISGRRLSEVWLAVLRAPGSAGQAREEEDASHKLVSSVLNAPITFKSFTVGVCHDTMSHTAWDCSPVWDAHFLHDPRTQSYDNVPSEASAGRSPMALCAMVALCQAGGWAGAKSSLPLPSDRHDSGRKPVRFVHCKMRVLHIQANDSSALPSQIPTEPPWPLPKASGVVRALPGTRPPLSLKEDLVASCRFACSDPPVERREGRRPWLARVARGVFFPVPELSKQSKHEEAVNRLSRHTGVYDDDVDHEGFADLQVDSWASARGLSEAIRKSDFPLPRGSSGAAMPTPDVWSRLRSAMFGLVDASDLPDGLEHPKQTSGQQTVRLVWTDPSGLAPSPDDAAEGQEEGAGGGGQPGDSLLEQVTDSLRWAVHHAVQGFIIHAKTLTSPQERHAALGAQKQARRVLLGMLAALCLVGVFALDQAQPFLGDLWEWATPWGALRLYGSRAWPIGWFLVMGAVAIAGLLLFLSAARGLLDKLEALDARNTTSKQYSLNASHYASEILRLTEAAAQFDDHKRIIVSFLYRPFGPKRASGQALSDSEEMAFAQEPPPSMIVAWSDASEERQDEWHKEQAEETIEAGWMRNAFRETARIHAEKYKQRVLGDHESPDHDTTPRGSTIHKDRVTGEDVYGARTDFLLAVVGDGKPESSGWAVKQAADLKKQQLLEQEDANAGQTAALLHRLRAVTPLHGRIPALDCEAVQFMAISEAPHPFSWGEILREGADRPHVDPFVGVQPPCIVGGDGDGSLAVAWHFTMSDPVQSSDLAAWAAEPDRSAGLPEQHERQIV